MTLTNLNTYLFFIWSYTYKYIMKYSVGAQCCFRGELPCGALLFGHFIFLNVLVLNVQFPPFILD